MVFSGTNSRYLAEKICNSLGCELGNMNIMHFADGEFAVSYEESIRGAHVFLVQSTPNVMLTDVARAAKRMSSPRYARKNQSRMIFSTATEMFIHMLKLALPQMRR